jgi:CRISPR-associated endonuclease/helicase Cas3
MIISHPAHKEYQRKPLTEHLLNVAQGCKSRIQRLSLATRLITKEDLVDLAFQIGLYHDLGKASSFFQNYICGGARNAYCRHSLVSALVLYFKLIQDKQYRDFALMAFKAVQRHHGNLSSFGSEGLDNGVLIANTLTIYHDLRQQIHSDNVFSEFARLHKIELIEFEHKDVLKLSEELEDFEPCENADDAIERFLLQNLLFSVLIDSDKYDAARIGHYPDQYLNQDSSYSPVNYLNSLECEDNELNAIRNELLSAATNISLSPTNCYAMTAPTGSGKTFACLGFAEALQSHSEKKRRVIYCLPYTSIIDQNFKEISKIMKANDLNPDNPDLLLKHHHLVDFSRQNPDENYDYHDFMNDNLLADSWNSACVVSTFVQFFHSLIGSRNSLVRKLHNIINSIVLLDEVQSLPPKYYPLLRRMFSILAQRFDTRILTCTATQPFIFTPKSYAEICPPALFDHPVFNRVKLRISQNASSLEAFVQDLDLSNADNALFVMNTKRCAIRLYGILKDLYQGQYSIYCLTTFHTPKDRLCRLEKLTKALENKEHILLVSTQLIEAGVDLSFQRVYRDFAPLDSIIQVAGRCNRHSELGELGGEMQLMQLQKDGRDYCRSVYDPYLLQKTKELMGDREYLESKDFSKLILEYYLSLEFEAEAQALMNAIKDLNYDQDYREQLAIDRFRLIENDYASISFYVLSDPESQSCMEELIRARESVKSPADLDQNTESKLRLIIKQCYHKLVAYQLSLSPSEFRHYDVRMSFIDKLGDSVYYIGFDDFEKAYNPETGFIIEPTESGSALSL